MPPAEQNTELPSSADRGPSQLLTPTPSPVLQPVLWETAWLISLSTNLLGDKVLVPSMLQI